MTIIVKAPPLHINPPHRQKIVNSAVFPKDWKYVGCHFKTDGDHLIVHNKSYVDHTVFEIHRAWTRDGSDELTECVSETFKLDPEQRYELALYLLDSVDSQIKNIQPR